MTAPRTTTDAAPPTRPEPVEAERARAIVASLRTGEPTSAEMFEAFFQLDSLPEEQVRQALADWLGPLPDIDRLDAARRLSLGLPLRPLRLRTGSVAKDADILDLGPIAEEQLRIAGMSWDGADIAPEDRLDGEVEGSLAGTFERRVLADAESAAETPLFDVLLYGEDAGVVFAAGTTKVIALIAYGIVETRDRRTRTAIQEALATPVVVAAEPRIAVTGSPPAIDTAVERREGETVREDGAAAVNDDASAKQAPAKKSPAKKSPAKKSPAKKSPAKTAPAKKAPAKKAPARKAPAKKAPAKKAPAKKAPAKKAPAKKAPAKKPRGGPGALSRAVIKRRER